MPLESATHISDFVLTNPDGTVDTVASLDNHIRMMKTVLQTDFPGVSGPVTATHTELNYVDGVTSAIQTQLDAKASTASPALTGVPTAPTAAVGTATTQIATTLFVDNAAFASVSGLTAATQAEMEAGTEVAQRSMSPLRVSQAITSLGKKTPHFGDGSDGNVTISAGTTTLTRNMYYNNLTINGTGSLDPAGYQVFVMGTLDLTAAPAGAIKRTAIPGGNAVTTTGGTAPSAMAEVVVGGAGQGLVGKSASAIASTQAVKDAKMHGGLSGATKTAGASTTPTAGGAGAAKPAAVTTNTKPTLSDYALVVALTPTLAQGGVGGAGGPSGGNLGGNAGGGGGAGGDGGGVLDIRAATISRGASTTAGAISAVGGAGGNGAQGAASGTGAGSGGAGGGGGFIQIVYSALSGATATNCLDVSGGAGGNGAAAFGAGGAGQGADGGDGGRVRIINTAAGTITENVSAVTGSTNTTTTGGAGAVARYDL